MNMKQETKNPVNIAQLMGLSFEGKKEIFQKVKAGQETLTNEAWGYLAMHAVTEGEYWMQVELAEHPLATKDALEILSNLSTSRSVVCAVAEHDNTSLRVLNSLLKATFPTVGVSANCDAALATRVFDYVSLLHMTPVVLEYIAETTHSQAMYELLSSKPAYAKFCVSNPHFAKSELELA